MHVRSLTPSCLQVCAATPLFRVESQVYTWREVVAFAEFRDALGPLWTRTEAGLAAAAFAEAHDLPLTPDDLEQGAEQLRYRLRLITADDTLDWLKLRDLSLDDFEAYLWRHLNREHVADRMADVLRACPVEPAAVARQLWSEAHFAAEFSALVMPLARHALVRDLELAHADAIQTARPLAAAEWRRRAGLTDADDLPAGSSDFLEMRAAYLAFQDSVASADHCRRRLRAQRSRFVHIEYELASFASRDVASEAHMCVTLDGEPLSTVASRAMCAYQSARTSVDELPEELGGILLSAELGDYLEPFEYAGDPGIHIARVIRKHSPALDDPEVLDRLRDKITCEALDPYLDYRLHWLRWRP